MLCSQKNEKVKKYFTFAKKYSQVGFMKLFLPSFPRGQKVYFPLHQRVQLVVDKVGADEGREDDGSGDQEMERFHLYRSREK